MFKRDGTLPAGIAAGVLFALEFLLIYRGLIWTTATRAVLFLYLAPFFVVIGSRWFIPGDHFYPSQWFGLALSFVGIVIAFGLPTPAADPRQMLGDLMMLGAAAAWAATTLVIKASRLTASAPEKTMLYQLVVSAPLLGDRRPGLRRTHRRDAVGAGDRRRSPTRPFWVVSVTFVDLVRADRALFGEPIVGVYVPDPAVWRRRRPSRSRRAADPGFCAGRGLRGRWAWCS